MLQIEVFLRFFRVKCLIQSVEKIIRFTENVHKRAMGNRQKRAITPGRKK